MSHDNPTCAKSILFFVQLGIYYIIVALPVLSYNFSHQPELATGSCCWLLYSKACLAMLYLPTRAHWSVLIQCGTASQQNPAQAMWQLLKVVLAVPCLHILLGNESIMALRGH
jgi:hypothetical protein